MPGVQDQGPGTLAAARVVAAKELRTLFRDRQTVVYAVVLPLAMYPVLFWVLLQAVMLLEGRKEQRDVRIGLAVEQVDQATAARLDAALADPAPDPDAEEDRGRTEVVRADAPLDRDAAGEWLRAEPDADAARLDAVVWLPADEAAGLALLFDGSRPGGEAATDRVRSRLRAATERWRAEALREAGHEPEAVVALEVEEENLATEEEQGAFVLSLILPMMLVVMAVMGAFYPAVDLTAGERERRTEETTLLPPVPRLATHLGKLGAVSAAALLASAMNLLGMALASNHLLGMLGGDIAFRLPADRVLLALPFAALFVVFASAVLVAAASTTKTFKQGQSLLGGVQMVFIVPAMASTLPGVVLTPGIAAIPIVGIAIAFRTLLRPGELSDLPVGPLLVAAAVQAALAAVAVWLSLRLMGREVGADEGAAKGLRRLTDLFRAATAPR